MSISACTCACCTKNVLKGFEIYNLLFPPIPKDVVTEKFYISSKELTWIAYNKPDFVTVNLFRSERPESTMVELTFPKPERIREKFTEKEFDEIFKDVASLHKEALRKRIFND